MARLGPHTQQGQGGGRLINFGVRAFRGCGPGKVPGRRGAAGATRHEGTEAQRGPLQIFAEQPRSQTRFGRTRPDLEAEVRSRPVRVQSAAGRMTVSAAQGGWMGSSSGHGKRSSRSGLHRSCGVRKGGAHQLHAGEQCGEVSEDVQNGSRKA